MDYQELDSLIDQLRSTVHATDPHKGYWKELWDLVRMVGAGFKEVRYNTREEKDRAWQRFQDLCAEAKKRGDANRREMEKRQNEWERRKSQSASIRGDIEGNAAKARPLSALERGISDIVLFPLTIIERIIGKIIGRATFYL